MRSRRNPCELEIDLFCNGLRIDDSCRLEEDARVVARTRAGLGSGLELVIPGGRKDIWLNAPVEEDFARSSPYRLSRDGHGYWLHDERTEEHYAVRLPEEPSWYKRKTSRGVEMGKVGVLQGTYLGIYISNSCLFWYSDPSQNCRFCTTGSNVGVNEVAQKHLEDVVEVALAAKRESGVTFVHFNSGYQAGRDLALAAPYVRAIKERVGALVGVQLYPTSDLEQYDRLIELGADHFSFCYEFQNPEYFARYLPGKDRTGGQELFFKALEYTSKRLGKGAVSGEIIAGVEPIEDTLRAIDYITSLGAFPTVCVFRPVIGADMERLPPPRYDDMRRVFAHVYEACRRNGIPIGAAPNIEVSLIVQPDDARDLAKPGLATALYDARLAAVRALAGPLFAWKSRRRRMPQAALDALIARAKVGPTAAGEATNGAGSEAASGPCLTNGAGHGSSGEVATAGAERAARQASLREVFDAVRTIASKRTAGFEIEEREGVLEISPRCGDDMSVNRCRLKIFRPRENKDRMCAFFYKRSNLGWSRDRFSYGAIEFLPETLTREDTAAWLGWLRSGLDPLQRPARLRRAFLYSIPD